MTVREFHDLRDGGEINPKHIDFDNGYGACESFCKDGLYYLAIFHAVDCISWNGKRKIVIPRGYIKSVIREFRTKEEANSFYKSFINRKTIC